MSSEHLGFLHDLPDYLTGKVSVERRERIRDHLEHCPSCRNQWSSLRRMEEELRTRTEPAPPAAYWTRLPVDINERIAARQKSRFPSLWTMRIALPAGAAFTLLLLFLLVDFPLPGNDRPVTALHLQIAPILSQAERSDMELITQQYAERISLLANTDLLNIDTLGTLAAVNQVEAQYFRGEDSSDMYSASIDLLSDEELSGILSENSPDQIALLEAYLEKKL